MATELSIHDVTAIRVSAPNQLSRDQYRKIEIETTDGQVFRVVAYSLDRDGEATVEVEEKPDVPERHREAG